MWATDQQNRRLRPVLESLVALLLGSATTLGADPTALSALPKLPVLTSVSHAPSRFQSVSPSIRTDLRRAYRPGRTFYRGHFLPRLSRRLEGHEPFARVEIPGQALAGGEWMKHPLEHTARRGVEHATRNAMESYLLEETSLRHVVESLESRWQRKRERIWSPGAGGPATRRSAWDFDVGVSHWLPQLRMRYDFGSGDVRMSVDPRGRLGVDFRSAGKTSTSFGARLRPLDQEYGLSCSVAF